jgi:UDP-glucose 4-epimerase
MTDLPAILITGGAGYIGSHATLACLEAGYKVIVVDDFSTGVRANVAQQAVVVEADLADLNRIEAAIDEHDVQGILHFAGSIVVPESVENPGLYYQNNTVKTLGLAQLAARKVLKAFIFSSTAAVYSPGSSLPLDESAVKAPLSPYGWSKLMSEQMLADLSQAHGLPVGILRYFNVAGADPQGRTGQSSANATHLVKVACQVATGKRDVLPVFGEDYPTPDGTCIRDYIHVSDLADAHVHLLAHLLGGGKNLTANCGYGNGASVRDVIVALEALIQAPLPVHFMPRRAGDAPALVANANYLRQNLPWTPKFADLSSVIASALAWERQVKG